jgi:hypothetical protein
MYKEKKIILDLYKAISGKPKTLEMLKAYISDPTLIDSLLNIEEIFPAFRLLIDEITTEGKRTVVKGRIKGKQIPGETREIRPLPIITQPFAMGYLIEKNKICRYWVIADQTDLLKEMN